MTDEIKVPASCCLIWIGIGLLNAFWFDRNTDFWFSYFKDTEVDVPFWLSAIASFLLGTFGLVLNIIGELARYAV